MQKVLVSSCLLGCPVRYNGTHKAIQSQILARWQNQGRIIAHCPEVAGGLPTPRPAAEIQVGDGTTVIEGIAKVTTKSGSDMTAAFLAGAEQALEICQKHNIKIAILKARSPSCGSRQIYDGTFSNQLKKGEGVTAALLRRHGITVFNEDQLVQAEKML